MSAADIVLLRDAEKAMRNDSFNGQSDDGPLLDALADWMHTSGADVWAHGPLCICGTGCDACDDSLWEPHARHALAVARAYLGES